MILRHFMFCRQQPLPNRCQFLNKFACNPHKYWVIKIHLFMQICFLLVYKKYFLLTIHLHQQKINEKTLKPVTFILTPFHQKINSFLLWKILLPSILLFLSHIFLIFFYSSKHPETPYLQNFERKIVQKTNQKEEDICIQEKLSQKDLIDV